jgi:tRNA(Met) C34 N-acetyltransferase TmcA
VSQKQWLLQGIQNIASYTPRTFFNVWHVLALPKAPDGDSPDLAELKASLASTPPSGVLVALAKTIDQAKAVLTFIEAISEKTLRSTVALTAGRGRGKSAALGISMAAAIAYVHIIWHAFCFLK